MCGAPPCSIVKQGLVLTFLLHSCTTSSDRLLSTTMAHHIGTAHSLGLPRFPARSAESSGGQPAAVNASRMCLAAACAATREAGQCTSHPATFCSCTKQAVARGGAGARGRAGWRTFAAAGSTSGSGSRQGPTSCPSSTPTALVDCGGRRREVKKGRPWVGFCCSVAPLVIVIGRVE